VVGDDRNASAQRRLDKELGLDDGDLVGFRIGRADDGAVAVRRDPGSRFSDAGRTKNGEKA
jgi:hypothetical protein